MPMMTSGLGGLFQQAAGPLASTIAQSSPSLYGAVSMVRRNFHFGATRRPTPSASMASILNWAPSQTALLIAHPRYMSTKSFTEVKAKEGSLSTVISKYIEENVTPYTGDASFLAPPTARTTKMWERCIELLDQEHKNNGLLDVDVKTPSAIDAFEPGYIDSPTTDLIVGLQTDAPLKRSIKPNGGWRIIDNALKAYDKKLDPDVVRIFSNYRKSHNEAVFDVYTPEMKVCRTNGILTGLPDGYGRGRIIGDYRRVALFGVDKLIEEKEAFLVDATTCKGMTETLMLEREETAEKIKALKMLKTLGKKYGYDISKPATNAREAIQWLYFAYLAAVKESDGAAMSLGRVDAFLDTYIEKDLKAGTLTESQAQELIDDFVIKLRLVRHLRAPEYNALFAGDPTWVTAVLGGTGSNNQSMVTKTSYRLLNTLYTLGKAPEPNLTVLWNDVMPQPWKEFVAKVSLDTSSIQYENDVLMRGHYGWDYGIACCVSGMGIGRDMQFFGARCNLPKLLLYALNGGKDEISGVQVAPAFKPLSPGPLKYDEVVERYLEAMDWLAGVYVDTMNVIHYSHDKYNYERLQMALHDNHIRRLMAFGVSGLSVVADSLSAIKYAKVTPVRNDKGITTGFTQEGEYPQFGNDDERVDNMAGWVVDTFMDKLRQYPTYRGATHTMSVLTITSNVVYGNATGDTPDGRKHGEPFAPGANPLHGRDHSGALASLNSVSSVPYESCLDGVSNTFTATPATLGKDPKTQVANLVGLLSGYFAGGGHHININTIDRAMLIDAMEHPEKYPQLTIRVSGYAVNFHRLTKEQQLEVIHRTFHTSI